MRHVDQRPTLSDSISGKLAVYIAKIIIIIIIIIIVSVPFNELLFSSTVYLQSKRIFMNLIITSANVKTFPL